jgi:hypothetical protein
MRLGKVQFILSYAVDLDNPDQVEVAKDLVAEDVDAAVKYNRVEDYFEIIEDSSLTEEDIHSAIFDLTEGDNYDGNC